MTARSAVAVSQLGFVLWKPLLGCSYCWSFHVHIIHSAPARSNAVAQKSIAVWKLCWCRAEWVMAHRDLLIRNMIHCVPRRACSDGLRTARNQIKFEELVFYFGSSSWSFGSLVSRPWKATAWKNFDPTRNPFDKLQGVPGFCTCWQAVWHDWFDYVIYRHSCHLNVAMWMPHAMLNITQESLWKYPNCMQLLSERRVWPL